MGRELHRDAYYRTFRLGPEADLILRRLTDAEFRAFIDGLLPLALYAAGRGENGRLAMFGEPMQAREIGWAAHKPPRVVNALVIKLEQLGALRRDEDGFLWFAYWNYTPPARQPLPRHLRERIIERDASVCGICGDFVQLGDLHIDHIVPVSLGGTNESENLQVAHSWCNASKGARPPRRPL